MIARTRVFALLPLIVCLVFGSSAQAQATSDQTERITTIYGRVLNSVTRQPIARALVVTQGDYAAFTDDRGQFELRISEQIQPQHAPAGMTVMGQYIDARKPGFLRSGRTFTVVYQPGSTAEQKAEVVIHLVPEALIVGHVDVPGSEGEVRIQCQLYRREMSEGRETWLPDRSFNTWSDGEFRFSELQAGTYKLITHEQMDRESTLPLPGATLYGYPPMYYPNTTDFSAATPIAVKAGETKRVNLSMARRQYHPVKIDVANMPAGLALEIAVHPIGHHNPGWSLGYNPSEAIIEGLLPDGTYTLEASTPGDKERTGILNFSVSGRPLEGPTLNLVPDAAVTVRVREEFASESSNFQSIERTVGPDSHLHRQRFSRVQVNLLSLDELEAGGRTASSQLLEGSQDQELVIPNVRPGRYRVEVSTGSGYAASIQSGGKDVAHQPLVVALGAEAPPIEILLRDDGAEVDGTLEENSALSREASANAAPPTVYVFPLDEGGGRPVQTATSEGHFRTSQMQPGSYLVVAFAQSPESLPYGDDEAMQSLASKGQTIHLEAGQKVNVKLKVIGSDED